MGILCVVLVLGCIGWTVYGTCTVKMNPEYVVPEKIIAVMTVLGLISALVYFVTGYKKESAKYLKACIYFYTAVTFGGILYVKANAIIYLITAALSFGVLCVLAVADNLGKAKSFALCGINVASAFARVAVLLLTKQKIGSGTVTSLVMAIILGICIYAKYTDKDSRGAK